MNYQDLSDWVRSMIKTRQGYELTNCASALYGENDTEL